MTTESHKVLANKIRDAEPSVPFLAGRIFDAGVQAASGEKKNPRLSRSTELIWKEFMSGRNAVRRVCLAEIAAPEGLVVCMKDRASFAVNRIGAERGRADA
jgi:hypothetical protein